MVPIAQATFERYGVELGGSATLRQAPGRGVYRALPLLRRNVPRDRAQPVKTWRILYAVVVLATLAPLAWLAETGNTVGRYGRYLESP